jgi:hypothetical protein
VPQVQREALNLGEALINADLRRSRLMQINKAHQKMCLFLWSKRKQSGIPKMGHFSERAGLSCGNSAPCASNQQEGPSAHFGASRYITQ